MRKEYKSAPLPFMGQKRMFATEFKKVIEHYPDGTTFVDLFGGSGLLSHIAKCTKPNSKVIYNDFDNYRERLGHIQHTNELLTELRAILKDTPRAAMVKGKTRQAVIDCVERHLNTHKYVDFITLSASLMFSMKYCLSLDDLRKEGIYNKVRKNNYADCNDYLDGLTIVSDNYKKVFEKYKNNNVVFLIDPPYLSTDTCTYKMNWNLSDYLDVLTLLPEHAFIYFTSNKSSLIELCQWIGRNQGIGNPFEQCTKVEFNAQMNYNSRYTDIMLYTKPFK